MGTAIRRADGTFRAWVRQAPHGLTLEPGEVEVEREECPEISPPAAEVYRGQRAPEYPSIGDQLDALYWARQGEFAPQANIDAKIAAVKAMFPKPTISPEG